LETRNRPVLDAVVRRGGREEQIGNLVWIGRYVVEFVLVGALDGVPEVVCIANDTHSLVGIVKELWNSMEGVAFDHVTRKTKSALSNVGTAHKGSSRAPDFKPDVLALLSPGLKTGSDGHRPAIEIVSQW
jgi:hypothetical protein